MVTPLAKQGSCTAWLALTRRRLALQKLVRTCWGAHLLTPPLTDRMRPAANHTVNNVWRSTRLRRPAIVVDISWCCRKQ